MVRKLLYNTNICRSKLQIAINKSFGNLKYLIEIMPHLRIETNLPKDKIPQDFVSKALPILAASLGKPTQFCVVSIVPDVSMCFGGSTAPCATANVMSIGSLGLEQNKKHSKVLYDLIEKELGIPKDRMYITYQDEPSSNVGFKGTTFHDIIG